MTPEPEKTAPPITQTSPKVSEPEKPVEVELASPENSTEPTPPGSKTSFGLTWD